jgi:hypothetical protein
MSLRIGQRQSPRVDGGRTSEKSERRLEKEKPLEKRGPVLERAVDRMLPSAPRPRVNLTGITQGGSTSNTDRANPNWKPKEGTQGATWQPVKDGTLYAAGTDGRDVHPSDISQGQLGDCYLFAGLGALAASNPDAIKNAISGPDKDGNYTVTFKEKGVLPWEGTKDVKITVTPDMLQKDGQPIYGRTLEDGGKPELWVAIVEKAYAQYRGGYDKIEGQNAGDFMALLTGRPKESFTPKNTSLADLERRLDAGEALVVGTYDEERILGVGPNSPWDVPSTSPLYAGEGGVTAERPLVADHAYFITDVDTEKGTVTLQNPWGPDWPPVVLTEQQFRDNFSHGDSVGK